MNFWLVAIHHHCPLGSLLLFWRRINKRHQTQLLPFVFDSSAQCHHLRLIHAQLLQSIYIYWIFNATGWVWGTSCSPDMTHRVVGVVLLPAVAVSGLFPSITRVLLVGDQSSRIPRWQSFPLRAF